MSRPLQILGGPSPSPSKSPPMPVSGVSERLDIVGWLLTISKVYARDS